MGQGPLRSGQLWQIGVEPVRECDALRLPDRQALDSDAAIEMRYGRLVSRGRPFVEAAGWPGEGPRALAGP